MMKQRLLKTIVLALTLLGGVNVALAQSTYSWSADNWANDYLGNGSVEKSSGTLICTPGQYCGSVSTTTSFKQPRRQTILVITGTNLIAEGGDPNVCNLNTNLGDGKLSGFP